MIQELLILFDKNIPATQQITAPLKPTHQQPSTANIVTATGEIDDSCAQHSSRHNEELTEEDSGKNAKQLTQYVVTGRDFHHESEFLPTSIPESELEKCRADAILPSQSESQETQEAQESAGQFKTLEKIVNDHEEGLKHSVLKTIYKVKRLMI
jgi:hypothetical protein